MKRIVLVLVAFFLMMGVSNAQTGFGIKGGLNFNSISDVFGADNAEVAFKGKTGFHAGILYKIKLPLGLAIQPELLYTQTNGSIVTKINNKEESFKNNVGFLQLPVNVQWGLDLVLFRPYVQVSPYIGYAVSTKNFIRTDYDNFRYGVGLGAGIEIWKLQVSGKYNWDLGNVGNVGNFTSKVSGKDLGINKSKGFELSLAVIF